MKTPEAEILDQIRSWLENGCTIKATDISRPILQIREDGTWIGNMTVTGNSKRVKFQSAEEGR